nr:hypothetical protein [uncultured bacterium]
MAVATPETQALQRRCRMTAEDLAHPGVPEKFVELVEGELIVMTPAGYRHNRVAYRLQNLFERFCKERPGLCFGSDNEGFLVKRNPDSVLSPDACLFRERPASGTTWMEFSPEIAAEVPSPSNSMAEMAFKRQRFFNAGTEQFWLAEVETSTLHIYFADGRVVSLQGEGKIEGEGILSGLKYTLAEVFSN